MLRKDFELIAIKEDKYYIKSASMEVPIELDKFIYEKWSDFLDKNNTA